MNKNNDVGPSRGSIICTASNAGIYPFPVGPLYAASKAGVIAFVRSMAPVIARNKIQINALAPAVLGEYQVASVSFAGSVSLYSAQRLQQNTDELYYSDQYCSKSGVVQRHDRHSHVHLGEGRRAVRL